MNKADRDQEWINILTLGKKSDYFAYCLNERQKRYNDGITSDSFTRFIRSEYRKFMRGEIGLDGLRPQK